MEFINGVIRLKEIRTAIEELRNLLDSREGAEKLYQDWCRKHSWAFGISYQKSDPVRSISAGDSVDFLLPTVTSGYRDVVELKRSDFKVLLYDRVHKNYYF